MPDDKPTLDYGKPCEKKREGNDLVCLFMLVVALAFGGLVGWAQAHGHLTWLRWIFTRS